MQRWEVEKEMTWKGCHQLLMKNINEQRGVGQEEECSILREGEGQILERERGI